MRADRLVEPGVLDRDGGLAGQQRQDLHVALVEGVELGAFEIEHADAAILQQQRNHQLRPRVVDDLDVARILRHVRHQHRLLVQRGVADQARSELDPCGRRLIAVADGDLHLELLGLLVQQQDAEGAVVDHAPGQVGDARAAARRD